MFYFDHILTQLSEDSVKGVRANIIEAQKEAQP